MFGPVADDHPFAGIATKLDRANENIINLHNEIVRFFKASKYPVIPKPNEKGWQEATDYHRDLRVPMRFSVLAGEIIHHLRSCLDHIVWHFSNAEARRDHENALEFPVFRNQPSKKDLPRYERKVQGIANPRVLALIRELQPYQGTDGANHLLVVIHDMDRFDKHRELVIVTTTAGLTFPAGTRWEIIANARAYQDGKTLTNTELAAVQRAVKNDVKISPQIAFSKVGDRNEQLVAPSLMAFLDFISEVTELFAGEL